MASRSLSFKISLCRRRERGVSFTTLTPLRLRHLGDHLANSPRSFDRDAALLRRWLPRKFSRSSSPVLRLASLPLNLPRWRACGFLPPTPSSCNLTISRFVVVSFVRRQSFTSQSSSYCFNCAACCTAFPVDCSDHSFSSPSRARRGASPPLRARSPCFVCSCVRDKSRTFVAYGLALISRSALAPRSNASGSNAAVAPLLFPRAV